MNQASSLIGLGFFLAILVSGCDSGVPAKGNSKPAESPGATGSQSNPPVAEGALMAPASSPAHMVINEGVAFSQQGDWDSAKEYFRLAVIADPDLAEAHYNLALTLDKLGKHEDATTHFKKALELAPENPAITESTILQAHLGR